MEPTKTTSINSITNVIPDHDSAIIVPTEIEIIEPITEEVQYLEEEFLNREERDEYNHLAYSQY